MQYMPQSLAKQVESLSLMEWKIFNLFLKRLQQIIRLLLMRI